MTTQEARSEFKAIQTRVCRAMGWDTATFNYKAQQCAMEFADGEPITPKNWLDGAHMLEWDLLP